MPPQKRTQHIDPEPWLLRRSDGSFRRTAERTGASRERYEPRPACPVCRGGGEVGPAPCPECDGSRLGLGRDGMLSRVQDGMVVPMLAIDMETCGLDDRSDAILEFTMIALTPDLLHEVDFGTRVLGASPTDAAGMSPFVRRMHEGSGLLEEALGSRLSLQELDQEVDDWLASIGVASAKNPHDRGGIMLGSSCRFDRQLVEHRMPLLDARLHYRMVDVTGIDHALHEWAPETAMWTTEVKSPEDSAPGAESRPHRARADIRRTIAQARGIKRALRSDRAPF